MQITHASLDAIYISFNTSFQSAFSSTPTWNEKVATRAPSASRENRYAFLDRLPQMRKWLGERQLNALSTRGYTLVNEDYEDSFRVLRNEIEDDQLGVFAPAPGMLGAAAAKWPDQMLKTVLQTGTSSTAFDGQFFFDTDHPENMDNSGSATYSNNFTGTALTATNFASTRASMMSYKGSDGQPLGVLPNLLIVPPQLEMAARQILNAEMIAPAAAFGQNGAAGPQTNVLRGSAELLVVPELANEAGTWYLADVSKPIKPLIVQIRKAPQFVQYTSPNDPNVFYRKEFIYGVDSRGAAGYTLPFLMARCIA